MNLLLSLTRFNLQDPTTTWLLIGLLLVLLAVIGSLPTPRPRAVKLPCQLHLWDVRQRRYVCRRCGFTPGESHLEADQN